MDYSLKKIAWVDCLFAHVEDAHSVTVQVMVKAGSIYETRKTNWLSHFLEHMFFKGWKKYKTPKEVAEAVDRIGGEFNAYTSAEYAAYYVKSSPEHVKISLDVLADMIVNAQFPKPEMEREKQVVVQEIKMYEDNPQRLVLRHRKPRFLGDNSYGRPILGSEENVLSFSQEDLFSHKENLYTKNNLLLVIAWNYQNQAMLESIVTDLFGWLPEGDTVKTNPFSWDLPEDRESNFAKSTEQNHLIITAPGFDWHDDKKYAASVLSTIIGWNMSSRLFQNIREKLWLCYYIGGFHNDEAFWGYFFFKAWLDKARFSDGYAAIKKELSRIADGDFSQEEFSNAIGYRVWKLHMGIETTDDLADFLWYQQLLYGEIETLDDLSKKYHQLSYSDVFELKEMLADDKLYSFYIH